MKLKVDMSLPKWLRLRVGLKLGLGEGAAVDLKLKLAGREPLRWKLALAPGKGTRERELGAAEPEPILPPAAFPPGKLTSG